MLKIVLIIAITIISLGIAKIGSDWLSGIARNPEAAGKMFVPAIMTLAFCELYGLVFIALLLI